MSPYEEAQHSDATLLRRHPPAKLAFSGNAVWDRMFLGKSIRAR